MLALMTKTFLAIKGKAPQALDAGALADLAPAIAIYERGILEVAPDVMATLAEAKSAGQPKAAASSNGTDLPVVMAGTRGVNVQAGDFAQAPLKTQRPPFLSGDAQAFAILMPDESMMPRFDAGDMLYVSPARALDGLKTDVVLERADGGFAVRSLTAATDDSVRVVTLSPREKETHDRAKLRGVYKIVGVQRLSN